MIWDLKLIKKNRKSSSLVFPDPVTESNVGVSKFCSLQECVDMYHTTISILYSK